MSRRCVRGIVVAAVVSVVVLAGVSSVSAASTSPRRCSSGGTYRLLLPVVARTRIVSVRSANVRRGPGTDCSLITSVRRGTRLNGTGRIARVGTSRWLEVHGTFGTGWVANSLLR